MRQRGGAIGVLISLGFVVVGAVVRMVLGGAAGGVIGFVMTVAAFPLLPIAGVPAADGTVRMAVAIGASLVVWWLLGQFVAGRVTQRAVAGWREWAREFVILGSGLWLGAIGAVVLAALVLGAL